MSPGSVPGSCSSSGPPPTIRSPSSSALSSWLRSLSVAQGYLQLARKGDETAVDGTGFGLAIVSRIADAHEWPLLIEERDGGGAKLVFVTEREVT